MSAETDIAAINDGGKNTAAEVRTALTSVLVRGSASIDAEPASPNAMDDEFDDASFDTGLWTNLNIGGVSKTEAGGVLAMDVNENADQLRGIYQATPSGNWTVQAKVIGNMDRAATSEIGLFAGESTTGNQRCVSGGLQGSSIRGITRTAPTAAASGFDNNITYEYHIAYMELSWDGTDLVGTASNTGIAGTWMEIFNHTTGYTPAIVGLYLTNRRGVSRTFIYDWFRRTA